MILFMKILYIMRSFRIPGGIILKSWWDILKSWWEHFEILVGHFKHSYQKYLTYHYLKIEKIFFKIYLSHKIIHIFFMK